MAKRVELATSRRLAVEPRLRQQQVDDDDRPVREREPVRPEERRTRPAAASAAASATRRSTSFHAATTSSAVPRTPTSQSVAIARLWREEADRRGRRSPARARRALTWRATSVNQRLSMRTGPGNSDRKVGRPEEVVLPRPRLPREVVCAPRQGLGQPVDEREPRVHLDREPAVRRRDEDPPTDAQRLADERLLALARRRRAR